MASPVDDFVTSCLQEECNTTWLNTGNLPAITFFRSLPVADRSLVIATIVIAFVSNILYGVQIFLMVRNRCGYNYIKLASTLLALYPVYISLSCIAMVIPRATSFISVLIGAYTMIVFNDFSNMISFVFGGFKRLLEKMDGQELQLPRLSRCLPKSRWTKKRVIVVRGLVRLGKLVFYHYLVLAAILLLNGNYERRPLEFDRPLFWFSIIAGVCRFLATVSLVTFVRSVVRVITGYSLGKKFIAVQVTNLFHLITGFAVSLVKMRIPPRPYGLVTVENRIDLYGYFAVVMVTTACQLWAIFLFHQSPKPLSTPQSSTRRGQQAQTAASDHHHQPAGAHISSSYQQRRTSSSYTVDTIQSSVASGAVDDSVRQVADNDELAVEHEENSEAPGHRIREQKEPQVSKAV